ncbi:hypothetical protein SAMN04489726_5387 [Allokutzneria albata]|uniref:Uncharacterized protein n=1 Tax=Allokutzneria albata TaxID=211114 RepID=A0A1G9ZD05_ALLAB|nr:hypothetical protein SAMN04489726_5387 [Allokutzneria albata]
MSRIIARSGSVIFALTSAFTLGVSAAHADSPGLCDFYEKDGIRFYGNCSPGYGAVVEWDTLSSPLGPGRPWRECARPKQHLRLGYAALVRNERATPKGC